MFSVPPYCGVPRLSHQFPFPAEVVVVAVVLVVVAVVVVLVDTGLVVVVVVDDVVVCPGVVALVQEPTSMALIIKKHKANQITLLFNFSLLFFSYRC